MPPGQTSTHPDVPGTLMKMASYVFEYRLLIMFSVSNFIPKQAIANERG
jgi:hypothetical protein